MWYILFASCFYIDIYCIMGCYYLFWYNTYAFSLLSYKVYKKMENVGSWNSTLEKEQIWGTYSAQLQKSWKSTKNYFGIYKKYWAKKIPQGTHQEATSLGARPCGLWATWQALGAHFMLNEGFWRGKKIKRKFSGWSTAVSRRNLGRTNLGLWRSYSAGKLPSGRGKSKPSSSPTILSSRGGQYPSTSSPKPSPLKP